MKKYYRIMLGKAGINFQQCYKNNLIGINFDFKDDFSNDKLETEIYDALKFELEDTKN